MHGVQLKQIPIESKEGESLFSEFEENSLCTKRAQIQWAGTRQEWRTVNANTGTGVNKEDSTC